MHVALNTGRCESRLPSQGKLARGQYVKVMVDLRRTIVLALAYFLAGRLGLLLAIPPGYATAVWPASGIALAGLLLWGYRVSPGVLIGSLLVNISVSWEPSSPLLVFRSFATATSIAAGSTLQALLGAFLIRRWVDSGRPFDRARDVFRFTGIELLSCLVAATWGVTTLCLAGLTDWTSFVSAWWTWWLGDLIGVLLVTPLMLTWSPWLRFARPSWRMVEGVLTVGILLGITLSVFSNGMRTPGAAYSPLVLVLIPGVVWLAFRFDQRVVTLATLLMSVAALLGATQKLDDSVTATVNQSLLWLQSFLGIAGLTGLTLSAALAEQTQAEHELSRAQAELEQRVHGRTVALAQTNQALQAEITERKQAEADRQLIVGLLVSAQEDERRRISRELHDQMGQSLVAQTLSLRAVQESFPDNDAIRERLQQLLESTDQMSRQVHSLAWKLRPAALDDLGLRTTLLQYLDDWSQRCQVAVDFHCTGLDEQRLPPLLETALYRILLEALTNVAKHARAQRVSVVLERGPQQVSAVVEDDGCGIDVDQTLLALKGQHRLGLLGMRERVALLGGTFQIESAPGCGTTLFVRIPLSANVEKGASDGEVAHPTRG